MTARSSRRHKPERDASAELFSAAGRFFVALAVAVPVSVLLWQWAIAYSNRYSASNPSSLVSSDGGPYRFFSHWNSNPFPEAVLQELKDRSQNPRAEWRLEPIAEWQSQPDGSDPQIPCLTDFAFVPVDDPTSGALSLLAVYSNAQFVRFAAGETPPVMTGDGTPSEEYFSSLNVFRNGSTWAVACVEQKAGTMRIAPDISHPDAVTSIKPTAKPQVRTFGEPTVFDERGIPVAWSLHLDVRKNRAGQPLIYLAAGRGAAFCYNLAGEQLASWELPIGLFAEAHRLPAMWSPTPDDWQEEELTLRFDYGTRLALRMNGKVRILEYPREDGFGFGAAPYDSQGNSLPPDWTGFPAGLQPGATLETPRLDRVQIGIPAWQTTQGNDPGRGLVQIRFSFSEQVIDEDGRLVGRVMTVENMGAWNQHRAGLPLPDNELLIDLLGRKLHWKQNVLSLDFPAWPDVGARFLGPGEHPDIVRVFFTPDGFYIAIFSDATQMLRLGRVIRAGGSVP